MRLIRKSRKGMICILLIICMMLSVIACASVAYAKENDRLVGTAAENFYFWGVNSNDPDFGGMSAPTGSFLYDGNKGYYYYDLHGSTGDYCFVVSKINNSGSTAVRTPAVGGAAESGAYFLQQGNYRGYPCMHIWNPAGDDVRIYFTSSGAGLHAVALSSVDDTPTVKPPTTASTPTSPASVTPTVPGGSYLYCKNDAGWNNVYIYLWNTDDDKNAKWPGVKMTNIGNGIWRYALDRQFANVIFNIGSEETQTVDMVNPGAGKIYNNKTYQWSDYGSSPSTTPTSSTTPSVTPTTPTGSSVIPTGATVPTVPGGAKVIYCENEAGWSGVYAYLWNNDDDKNAKWPGVEMTNVGNNIWRYVVPKEYAKIIFNIGSSETQTSDMNFPGYGYIYNNKTQKWTIYDTSPLQVQSFTTDLAAPQFAGVSITLSASASGQGTVRYKFSATDSAGSTKVIADYSTKGNAVWTPSKAGTYTLVYEFKDTAGNTNKRTATYKVEDGSGSVAPFIKQVTPASGQQIKKSAACKVTVSAAGGNTGTKLLFYKYTVTDAAGKIVNVPYYSRSTSFSFTPTALGKYTVTVSVQGSNNAAVERSYVYDSVNTVVVPTEPTEPHTAPPSGDVVIGDADNNGIITILDATRIQRYLAKLIGKDEINLLNADADRNGSVTILDATRIQRFLAKLLSQL